MKRVRENIHVALDRTKARLDEVGNVIAEKQAKKGQAERFLTKLERQDGVTMEFDGEQWLDTALIKKIS